MSNDKSREYQSGGALLAQWGCLSREQKLERACRALMQELNSTHIDYHGQDLSRTLEDKDVFCSCADAYRMGHEALKS